MKTPMSSSIKLDMDEKGKSVNSTMYRGMIESHLSAVKRILRYLKGTMDIGLWIMRQENAKIWPLALTVDQTVDRFWGDFSIEHLKLGFSLISVRLGLRGKRPVEPSQPEQTEARRKARYDMTLFSSVEDYQRYKQKFTQRKVVIGRSINFSQLQHFGFEGLLIR
ncbi:hypothetical protein AAG906_007398 [Vitis piasezkii]